MTKHLWKIALAAFLLALTFVLLWMNRFQYEHTYQANVLVRINRFTGQGCYFQRDGTWDSRLTVPAKNSDNKLVGEDSSGKIFLEDAGENTCH